MARMPKSSSLFAAIAPGVLVAATGVGAGDLLTAGLGGSAIGLAILWAAGVGALLKWFLNEGVARWQMATGTTLLEGWVTRLGGWIRWVFLIYLLIWTVFTSGALMNACGVAGTGLWCLGGNPVVSKVVWGVIHSLAALVLVWKGGFKVFEKLMSVCIAVMFVAVIVTAILIGPDWGVVGRCVVIPTIPPGGLGWVLGILGGVGGTVTLLSYGYWIREEGREGASGVRACRIDLAVGYTMTALFGVAMVIIGSHLDLSKRPGGLAMVALDMADQLAGVVGPAGRWVFLLGFWGAVFSSMLGVWQSVPYLFADFVQLQRGRRGSALGTVDLTKTRSYRGYLLAIALVPLPLLALSVKQAQLSYAILGSLFMPLLALTLLIMNNRVAWVGKRYRSGPVANAVLVATLLFFGYVAVEKARSVLAKRNAAQDAKADLPGGAVELFTDDADEHLARLVVDGVDREIEPFHARVFVEVVSDVRDESDGVLDDAAHIPDRMAVDGGAPSRQVAHEALELAHPIRVAILVG